jgi:Ni,Fe-hydrogenase I cytochrome b subunit
MFQSIVRRRRGKRRRLAAQTLEP